MKRPFTTVELIAYLPVVLLTRFILWAYQNTTEVHVHFGKGAMRAISLTGWAIVVYLILK